MKQPKDLFSEQAEDYGRFRPEYPGEFVADITSLAPEKGHAWDCATGNGQVAVLLAEHFNKVTATDISESQLSKAVKISNIDYLLARAEESLLDANSFDLITVGQAVHWFDFEAFYKEVLRVSKDGGILAVWGYGLLRFEPRLNEIIDRFYTDKVGRFWDEERKHIESAYKNIPFPFMEIQLQKEYCIHKDFTVESLAGYLSTWSAVQNFRKSEGYDPITDLMAELKSVWGDEEQARTGSFPLFSRIGKVSK